MFIMFARAGHLYRFWAGLIQSTSFNSVSIISISISSSFLYIDLQSWLFSLGFPTKTLYEFLLSPRHSACSAHLIFLDLITRILFDEGYKLWLMFWSNWFRLVKGPHAWSLASKYVHQMTGSITRLRVSRNANCPLRNAYIRICSIIFQFDALREPVFLRDFMLPPRCK